MVVNNKNAKVTNTDKISEKVCPNTRDLEVTDANDNRNAETSATKRSTKNKK